MRIRYGYDAHRLVPDRPLIIGGVRIPYERDLLGHSDADALPHAVADSLLGAVASGGLDAWFLDINPEWAGTDDLKLLRRTYELVGEKGYQTESTDAAVVT